MKNSSAIRKQVETVLAKRVPSALTPQMRSETVRLGTGVAEIDALTGGGLPMGAITEMVGVEGSGRTTLAMSFVAARMGEGQVGAWVDGSGVLDPAAASGAGMDLERLLWVRCGVIADRRGSVLEVGGRAMSVDRSLAVPTPRGGGGSRHPRGESKGMPEAIGSLMEGHGAGEGVGRNTALIPLRRRDRTIGTPGAPNRSVQEGVGMVGFPQRSAHREEQVASDRLPSRRGGANERGETAQRASWAPRCAEAETGQRVLEARGRAVYRAGQTVNAVGGAALGGTWKGLDQAVRTTDLLLQGGGFGVIVLDLGSFTAEAVWRVPLATWFRFRAAAERTRVSLLLLTQHACARSSAELVLEMGAGQVTAQGGVMTGMAYRAEMARQRFAEAAEKVVPMRKPPQPERMGVWGGQASWTRRGMDLAGRAR